MILFFLFFCKLSNHLSVNHLSIIILIDWLWCETWILWWSPELWDLFCTSFDRVVCTRLELYYDSMYRIIILCFSYLATWLPFLNKPIDWLIDWLNRKRTYSPKHVGLCHLDNHGWLGVWHLAAVWRGCRVFIEQLRIDVVGVRRRLVLGAHNADSGFQFSVLNLCRDCFG